MAAGDSHIALDPREMARLGLHSPQAVQRRFDRRVTLPWQLERQRVAHILEKDDEILSDRMAQLKQVCGVSLREQELSDAIQNYCSLMAFWLVQGADISYDDAYREINLIAEEHGFLSGVPIPITGDGQPDLVMAEGVPLAEIFHMNQQHRRAQREHATEMAGELVRSRIPVRNSWRVLGDKTVCVVDTTEGPMVWPQYDAGMRLRKLVRGVEVRHHAHQRAEAEMRALQSLRTRISEGQYDSYVLSGLFPERSKRSDVWYYFRKGLPTLAVSFHGKHADSGKVLAALCLHPMGYYQGTHVGLMTPTDEVIAHLLMMRSDERRYWAKSGQWAASDPRSGV
jgi:hypothetical protein